MKLADDKIKHLKAGFVIALLGAALGAVLAIMVLTLLVVDDRAARLVVLMCAATGSLACGLAAGLTKEFADHMDNRISPGMHGVEAADAICTALPGFALSLLLACYAVRVLTLW